MWLHRVPLELLQTPRAAGLVLLALATACVDGPPDAQTFGTSMPAATAGDAGAAAAGDAASAAGEGTTVTVAEGKVHGKVTGKTRSFLGIPYAKPPIGDLRFAPPVPADAWTKTLEASDFGPSCPQPKGGLAAMNAQSEDCLSLNVIAPTGAKKLPVIVWIHGGAFIAGGSSQYDATRLAGEGPVVVVTINYRLGALGLLSLPELDAARDTPSGNDALRDQQLALNWVKKNVAAFGGDPANITLAGESAGSQSVCMHMVAPGSQSLVNRFVLESGPCVGGLPVRHKDTANATGKKLLDELCPDATDAVACLRGLDADAVINWGNADGIFGAGWSPLVDAADEVLPQEPVAAIMGGSYNKGELLLGTNKHEWALFLALDTQNPAPSSVQTLNAAIEKQFGAAAGAAIEKHYAATDANAKDTFVQLMTDAVFRCPTRALARLAAAGGSKVYLYSFEEGPSMHAFEIPYVLGVPNAALGAATLVEPLRDAMQSYWRQFAKTGDPNVSGQPEWPAYDMDSDQNITLQADTAVDTNLSQADCDFWTALLAMKAP